MGKGETQICSASCLDQSLLCPLTFYVLHPLLGVSLPPACVAIPPVVAGPELEHSLVVVVAASHAAESVVDVPDVVVAASGVDLAAVVFVGPVAPADAAEPQASVDIAPAFVVLAPVSAGSVEDDSSGRPSFPAFPNVDHYASASSSAATAGSGSVHSSMGGRTNYALCSSLSNPDLHHNKTLEHCCNRPSPGHNNASDTSGLPMAATTSHSRKIYLHLPQEQRIHRSYQATQPQPEALRIRWAAAEEFQCLCLHSLLPLIVQERQ